VPLRDDLLNPIPGDNPSGVNLRYDKVYDQIKEARTESEESILGTLSTPKKADLPLVIKLAGEALAKRTKDLQLAAWLFEAHVKKEGIGLIGPCLKLFLDLQEQFWDTMYPEIEPDDKGLRAVPLEWAANRVASLLREAPITRDGLNSYQYKDSRSVGYEAEAEYNESKREARQMAIADGKITGEDWDKSFNATPKAWYVNMSESMNSATETLDALQSFCEEKYGDDSPGFGKLRTAFEEVGAIVNSLLNEKRKAEPDEPTDEPAGEDEALTESAAASYEEAAPAAAAVAAKPRAGKSLTAEPVDKDDAIARVQACAKFFQTDNPNSPVAYLLQTSLRFGEMREQGSYPSYDFLVPPTTEIRQNLKRLAAEQNWVELLNAAVIASGEPCGRAWLDVHRYVWKACNENGNAAVAATVITTLQSLIKDLPEIATWTLSDDTPTANPETQRWLEEMVIAKPPEPVVVEAAAPEPAYYAAAEPAHQGGEDAEPDILDMAREMMSRGQLPQAIQLLMRDASQQSSGRGRFLRRLQMAQLCVNAGQAKVAYPVLEELVKEIDHRQLEEWEATDMIAPPFALLLRCLGKNADENLRESVFSRLCRIDPIAAMDVSR